MRPILCDTVQTYTMCTTIIATITTSSLLLCAYNLSTSNICLLFFSYNYSLSCSQPFRKRWPFIWTFLSVPFSIKLVVVSLLGSCSMNLLVFIFYALSLVAFAFVAFCLSISFTLMIFFFVTFAYCFQVKWC